MSKYLALSKCIVWLYSYYDNIAVTSLINYVSNTNLFKVKKRLKRKIFREFVGHAMDLEIF